MLMIKSLVLICGPPACLKSTLISILRWIFHEQSPCNLRSICVKKLDDVLKRRMKYYFLTFDELFAGYEKEIFENEFNWKSYRSLIADEIERLISNPTSEPSNSNLKHSSVLLERLHHSLTSSFNRESILFIEDNFYYSSMRHRYRQIAQRAHLGFLSIHLHSNLSIALQRNSQRDPSKRVSNVSLENIYSKYEFSDEDLLIDTTDRGLTSEHLQRILRMIEHACAHPEEVRYVIDEDQRRKDREMNEENRLYQLDQRLRKSLSKYLKDQFEIKKKFTDSNSKKIYAEKINEKRQEYLELIRRKCLHITDDHQIEQNFYEYLDQSMSTDQRST